MKPNKQKTHLPDIPLFPTAFLTSIYPGSA